jgi:steroid delta-isomerase-like uncharacterized protein
MKAQQSDSARIGADVVEAFNQSDWGRLRACLSDNVIYEETGTGRRVTGADDYVELCRGWKQAFADVAGTIQRSVANDDLAALEIVWEGTHTGPLTGPGGTIPPTGRRSPVPATMWVETSGGKVKRVRHHLDMLGLLQAIGAMPQPAGAGAG